MQEIVWLVCNNGDVEASANKALMERFPLMELKYGEAPAFVEVGNNHDSARLWKRFRHYWPFARGIHR